MVGCTQPEPLALKIQEGRAVIAFTVPLFQLNGLEERCSKHIASPLALLRKRKTTTTARVRQWPPKNDNACLVWLWQVGFLTQLDADVVMCVRIVEDKNVGVSESCRFRWIRWQRRRRRRRRRLQRGNG